MITYHNKVEMPPRIHCGKNAAVDENLSHVVNNPRNLWPVTSDPHKNDWRHKRK